MVADRFVVGEEGVARQIDVGRLAVPALAVIVVPRKGIEGRVEVGRTTLFGAGIARHRHNQSGDNRPVGLDERIARHVVRLVLDLVIDHHGIAVVLGLALEVGAVTVVDRPERVAPVARTVVVGTETAHEPGLGLQVDAAGDHVVIGHVDRILLEIVLVLHAFAVIIAQAHVVAVLLAAALDSDAVILRNRGAEHVVGPFGAERPFAALDFGDRGVIGAVRPYLSGIRPFSATVLVGFVFEPCHLHGVTPVIELVAENADADLSRKPDVVVLLPAAFGRYHDDAVGSARTVNCGRRGIFQHLNRLDDVRIDAGQVARVAHRHAVDHHQRRIGAVDGADTAHAHRHVSFRAVIGIVDYRQAGHAALQQLVDRTGRNLRYIRGLHGSHAARQVALLHRTVTDHDNLFDQFGILFEAHVDGRTPADGHFLRFITEERDD